VGFARIPELFVARIPDFVVVGFARIPVQNLRWRFQMREERNSGESHYLEFSEDYFQRFILICSANKLNNRIDIAFAVDLCAA
jgi:hypothetical protein